MKIRHNFKILEDGKTISGQILDVDFEGGERGDMDYYHSKDGDFLIVSSACPYLSKNYLYVWGDVEIGDNDILEYTYETKKQAQQVLAYINEFNMEKEEIFQEEETFEEGELVEVSDNGVEWYKAGFLMYSTKNGLVYTASISDQNKHKVSDFLGVTSYKYVKKIPKTKQITIPVTEEQEEKLKELGIIIK